MAVGTPIFVARPRNIMIIRTFLGNILRLGTHIAQSHAAAEACPVGRIVTIILIALFLRSAVKTCLNLTKNRDSFGFCTLWTLVTAYSSNLLYDIAGYVVFCANSICFWIYCAGSAVHCPAGKTVTC